jgi:hypothetical protein
VARAAKQLDLDSPLARQLQSLSERMGPLMLKAELDPQTTKSLSQDLVTIQAALGNRAALKVGQLDPGTADALTRVMQLMATIEQSQAFSADLSVKAAAGYERQKLELQGADEALGRSVAKLALFGITGSGFLAQARAVVAEMARAVKARNDIEKLTLGGQALQSQRQSLTAEMELAKVRGDMNRVAELTLQIDELDGHAIDLNAAKARAANVEQYRGRADLLQLAQDGADAATDEAKAKRETALIEARRFEAQSALAHAMRPGAQRLDEVLNQRALDMAADKMMDIRDAVIAVRREAAGIGEGFKQGMDEALRIYSDSATRMMEASRSLFESIHDEGARSLSGLFQGTLSGGDALRQFGRGLLGGIADQASSLIMDRMMGGLFGLGHDKDMNVTTPLVNINAGVITGMGGIGAGVGGGLLGGLLGGFGIPGFANGGIVRGSILSEARSYSSGGYAVNPQMAMIGDNPGRAEAIVPLPGVGRGIPVEFRGGSRGGVTINQALAVHLTVHSVDPRGAADIVLAQMPQIQRAITSALVRGSDRALRDAVQGAVR